MKKIIVSIPILTLLFISCVTYGEELFIRIPVNGPDLPSVTPKRRGAFLEIHAKYDDYITGELIAVQKNVLYIQDWLSFEDLSIDIGTIKSIKFTTKSRAKEGMIIGGTIGALIGRATYNDSAPDAFDLGPALNTAAGGLIGMALGGSIGATVRSDQTIQVEGKSHAEIAKILEYLRTKSRIPH